MTHFIQTLISGLSLGSIYALIALGYTMVYGIAKMLNFAHGDIIMIGAYAGIIAVAQMGLPPLIAVLLSILICALLGVLIEFLAYKPLRQAPPLSVLITAIGVSYFLQNLALILFGSQQKAYPTIVQCHHRWCHHPYPAGHRAHHGGAFLLHQPHPYGQGHAGRQRG